MTFPQPVFSPVVTAGGLTLAFEASALDSGNGAVTGPSSIIAGDLLALFDLAGGFSAPTAATPSGFTTAQDASSSTTRGILSYKIADGAEADSSLTGMSDITDGKVLLVFRPSSPLSSASHASGGGEITGNDPSSQSVLASNGVSPVVVLACYYFEGSPLDPRTFSPAKDDEVENTERANDQYFAYRIDNSNPQDTTVDMENEGNNNTLLSTYIEVS